jgi:hypothetical protein
MPRLQSFALAGLLVLLSTGSTPGAAQRRGADELGLLQIGRLHYAGGGDWYANPSSLPNLHRALAERTGLPTADEEQIVTLDDERLFRFPFLYATGHGTIRPSPADIERLRRYLDAGGFLWADDNYGLDRSFRELVSQLYPDSPLVPIGSDHPIYAAYYRLPGLPKIHEHDGDPAQGFGVFRDGRMVIFYSWSSDIGDGLEDAQVHNDPPEVRETALRMAINIVYFALTQS